MGGVLTVRKSLCLLSLLWIAVGATNARADAALVTLNFDETTVLDGTTQGIVTGVPLTFETNNEILSIAIDWADTGTANAPFPQVYSFEDNVVLGTTPVDSICNYLYQNGPSSYYTVDCTTLATPYVSSVAYSGAWGSVEVGFGGTVPITIASTFTQQTIVPEAGSLRLLCLGLVGLSLMVAMGKRIPPDHP